MSKYIQIRIFTGAFNGNCNDNHNNDDDSNIGNTDNKNKTIINGNTRFCNS